MSSDEPVDSSTSVATDAGVTGTGGGRDAGSSRDSGGTAGGTVDAAAGPDDAAVEPPGDRVVPPDGGAAGQLSGTNNVWTDVTPSGMHLEASFNPADNFGVQDVLADPAHPGTFYAFACYQGVWKSVDFGGTWTRVDRNSPNKDDNLEQGRPWGEAIAPDGSYMLACTGYGTGRWGAFKSTDGGVNWKKYPIADNSDPYMYDIDPTDARHVLSTSHSVGNIYESTNGGETWVDRGDGGVGASGYVFFISKTTWLLVAQGGNGGTRRTTNGGKSWSSVGSMEHVHGGEQIYIDPDNGYIYVPSHSSTNGIYLSKDQGATFTKVASPMMAAVFATKKYIYAMDSGASTGGNPPNPMRTSRTDGTNWEPMSVPAKMTNGPKTAAVAYDAASDRWVIVSGSWNAGIWRYIEK